MSTPKDRLPEGFNEVSITPQFIDQEAKRFGLSKSSGYRPAGHNKAVGGVSNSYHLSGQAGDYTGSREQKQKFYNYLKKNYGYELKELLDEGDHIHIAATGLPEGFTEVTESSPKPKPTKATTTRVDLEAINRPKGEFNFSAINNVSPNKRIANEVGMAKAYTSEDFIRQAKESLKAPIKSTPVEKEGFVKRLAQGFMIPTSKGELIDTISDIGRPDRLLAKLGESQYALIERGANNWNPNIAPEANLADPKVMMPIIAGLIPIFGPQAASVYDDYKRGDIGGAVGTITAMGIQAFLPKLVGKIKGIGEVTEATMSKAPIRDIKMKVAQLNEVQQAARTGRLKNIKVIDDPKESITSTDNGNTLVVNEAKVMTKANEGKAPEALEEGIRHEAGVGGHIWIDANKHTEEFQTEASDFVNDKWIQGELSIQDCLRIEKSIAEGRGFGEDKIAQEMEEKFVERNTKTGREATPKLEEVENAPPVRSNQGVSPAEAPGMEPASGEEVSQQNLHRQGEGEQVSKGQEQEGQAASKGIVGNIPEGFEEVKATTPSEQRIHVKVGDELRSFPLQLDRYEMPTGNDLYYEVLPMKEMYGRGLEAIQEKGIDGTIEWIKNDPSFTSDHVAAGTILIDKLKDESIKLGKDSPEAQALWGKANEIASTLSEKLTKNGQTTKAADIARLLGKDFVVNDIKKKWQAKNPDKMFPVEQEMRIRELVTKLDEADKEIKRLNDIVAKKPPKTAAPKEPKPKSKFFTEESIAKDKEFLKTYWDIRKGSGGPGTDYLAAAARVGAYYLETGAKSIAQWSEQMIKDLGEQVKPYLDEIRKESYNLLMKQRKEKALDRASIKELDAIDEIREEIKRDRELAREEARSEKRSLISRARASLKAIKDLQRQEERIIKEEANQAIELYRGKQDLERLQEREYQKEETQALNELRRRERESERKTFTAQANEAAKNYKEMSRAERMTLASLAREQKKASIKQAREAERSMKKSLREEEKTRKKAEADTRKWDYPIRRDSQEASTRLISNQSVDRVGDMADVGAEGLLKIFKQDKDSIYTEKQWSEDMTSRFGKEFTDNRREVLRSAYEKVKEVRDRYKEARELELATKGQAGAMTWEQRQELLDRRESMKLQRRNAITELGRVYANLDRWSHIRREFIAAANLPRAIMASTDLSAAGRQGMIFTLTHPVESAKIFFNEQIRALTKNPDAYRAFENEILWSDEDFPLSRKAGIDYSLTSTDRFGTLAQVEEAYMTDLPVRLAESEKAWVRNTVGIPMKLVTRSEQAYATFLNMQRLRMFKLYCEELRAKGATWETHPQEYKAIADFINKATGKGDLGKFQSSAPLFNVGLFAPKWVASRFQLMNMMLNPVKLYKMPPLARRIMMREGIKFTGVVAGTLFGLSQMKKLGADIDVGTDPDDPDFLKVRWGQTHYDISGGFQQEIKFMFQLTKQAELYGRGKAMTRRDAKLVSRYSKVPEAFIQDKTAITIVEEYLRRKASPTLGVAWDYASGETLEYDSSNRRIAPSLGLEVRKTLIPMVLKDFYEGYKAEGAKGAIKATPTVVGIGTQSYPRSPMTETVRGLKNMSREAIH